MSHDGGSSVPRRQVGRLLRQLRDGARITLKDAAAHIEVSLSKMSRIEGGEAPVRQVDVRALADLYAATPDMLEVLLSLAAATKEKGWWAAYGKAVPAWFELYVGMEQAASRLRHYENGVIPGLLQGEEYAAAVLGAVPGVTPEQVTQRVRLRRERQRLLGRANPPAPELDVIIEEAVLVKGLGDQDAWARQLAHLVNISQKPGISVRIIPRERALHYAGFAGSFTVLDFPEVGLRRAEPTTVYIEGLTGALYLDETVEVDTYERAWDVLDRIALDRDASDDLIGELIKENIDD
ncbi:hypothetical protein J2S43_004202 [Catenuloplanes nepalensis]|uniref:HTH cro/C1-type domain-containing protein n=1 Tax=Catenuloplanes nepalensis TaxID=587533 RepID=A0ABT9MWD2_9ACTN|nr:helix-turn-helix transcriptional regulator [Catenuloplanes nepalensis]MDP9795690.1 hypothetical protein [Catenuloplanes nepalensis]